MTPYQDSLKQVMALNGTYLVEWESLPTTMTQHGPLVSWPNGAGAGKTIFVAGMDACCELCGKKIKNVYGIFHPAKNLTLRVGSECVRHVGTGLSGEEVAKEAARAEALADSTACIAWIQSVHRLAGMRGWLNVRAKAGVLISSYRSTEDKAEWYQRRVKVDSLLHQFLQRAVKVRAKLAAKGEEFVIPGFLLKVLDRLEGVVS